MYDRDQLPVFIDGKLAKEGGERYITQLLRATREIALDMKINDPEAYEVCYESDIMKRILPLSGKRVLELGCGKAWTTRMLVERFSAAEVVATEVDKIQHEKNLAITDLPQVRFVYGGAEDIDAPDAGFDRVIMFKSLHHVPGDRMDDALKEIRRVLRPGGLAYFSEPVYWGDFNEILRLFNDEKVVRKAAFETLKRTVENGDMELVQEVFFQAPGHYPQWKDFDDQFLNVTFLEHNIDDALYEEIKSSFMQHMQDDGVHLLKPHRVDLLRKY